METIVGSWFQGLPGAIPAFEHPPKPLPEQHPFYTLVGRVASEWSHLEHVLDTTIWELLSAKPELASCVTSQIMGVARCKAIATLGFAHGLDDAVLKALSQAIE